MVGAVFFALDLVTDLCLNRRRREEVNSATFGACSEYQIPAGLMMRGVESYCHLESWSRVKWGSEVAVLIYL